MIPASLWHFNAHISASILSISALIFANQTYWSIWMTYLLGGDSLRKNEYTCVFYDVKFHPFPKMFWEKYLILWWNQENFNILKEPFFEIKKKK